MNDLIRLKRVVTPLAGVWIEIGGLRGKPACLYVTPLAGVWIEIGLTSPISIAILSLPLRECGLKL